MRYNLSAPVSIYAKLGIICPPTDGIKQKTSTKPHAAHEANSTGLGERQ